MLVVGSVWRDMGESGLPERRKDEKKKREGRVRRERECNVCRGERMCGERGSVQGEAGVKRMVCEKVVWGWGMMLVCVVQKEKSAVKQESGKLFKKKEDLFL